MINLIPNDSKQHALFTTCECEPLVGVDDEDIYVFHDPLDGRDCLIEDVVNRNGWTFFFDCMPVE